MKTNRSLALAAQKSAPVVFGRMVPARKAVADPQALAVPQALAFARRGLTLLEVVISTAVFLAAASVILNMIGQGTRASAYSQYTTEAAFRAESILGEMLAEVRPMESVNQMPFEDDDTGGWFYSIERQTGDDPDLVMLKVRAWFAPQDRTVASVTLDRVLRDPAVWEEAAMAEAEAAEEEEL